MNEDFALQLSNRLADLTQDLRFTFKPDGSMQAPQIVQTMLPPKDQDYQEAEEFPMVRWVIVGGEFARVRPTPFSVRVDAGIYTPGDVSQGTTEITTLALALGGVVNQPWFSPYKLKNSVPFSLGSPEQHALGIQPHPYYWATLKLDFVVARGHGG